MALPFAVFPVPDHPGSRKNRYNVTIDLAVSIFVKSSAVVKKTKLSY